MPGFAQQPPRSGELLKELQDKPQAPPPTPAPSIEVPVEQRRAVKPIPGLKVDVRGNIWESAAGGVWIVSPEGKHLGTILTPELVANVEFGDPDHRTLYIAARTSVYRIRVNIAGIP